jgi:ketopantoate hydroxymethyltransferase
LADCRRENDDCQKRDTLRDRRKIVGVVAWDFQIARIVDRAGVEIVSVGDTVGTNLWGHASPLSVTMEEMIVVSKAFAEASNEPS